MSEDPQATGPAPDAADRRERTRISADRVGVEGPGAAHATEAGALHDGDSAGSGAGAADEFIGLDVGGAVLRHRIGVGGMGVVYEAWQDPPGRVVAVKLLRDALASEEERFRFRHEAHILASLTLVGALIAISLFAASESRARARAERQEARAKALLHVSAGFIPEVADHLDHKLGAILGTARVRNLLAGKLETLATKLAAIDGAAEDAEVAYAVGAAELAIARIRGGAGGSNLGEGRAALPHFLHAVEQFERAARAYPENEVFLGALIDARLTLADQFSTAGKSTQAREALAQVEPALARWLARAPGNPTALGYQIDLASAVGHAEHRAEAAEASVAAYSRALALTEAFPWEEVATEDRQRVSMLLQGHLNLATGLVGVGRAEEAGPHFQALNALAKQVEEGHANAAALGSLWHVHDKVGDFALDNDLVEEGQRRHERALAVAERLAAGDPNDAGARVLVRVSRGALGRVFEKREQHDLARRQYELVLTAVREELLREPQNLILQWDLRVTLTRLAAVETRLGEMEAARGHLDEARALQKERVRTMPDSPDESTGLAEVEYTEALFLLGALDAEATAEQEAATYRRVEKRLQSAVERLRVLHAAGSLPAPMIGNIAAWEKMIAYLGEAAAKLETPR